MSEGGDAGVLEIVSVAVAFAAEVYPGVRRLMNEERSGRADVAQVAVFVDRPGPRFPGRCRNWMCRRADRQQIHSLQLRVGVPARLEETRFGLESVVECCAAVQHPFPVHTFVDLGGELADRLGIEVSVGVQEHPARPAHPAFSVIPPLRRSLKRGSTLVSTV